MKGNRKFTSLVLLLFVVLLVLAGTAWAENSAPVPEKLLALTFDDGPSEKYTGKLLDALNEYDAKATFFLVGQNVGSNAELVRRMIDEGHEVGSHSWSHQDMLTLSESEIAAELEQADEAIYEAIGSYPTLFRAPYGNINDLLLEQLDVPSIYWSVDTFDWKTLDAECVTNDILDSAYDGAIILLHDVHETTVNGTIAALKELQAEGYTLVTVSELLSRNGDYLEAGVTYYQCKPAK